MTEQKLPEEMTREELVEALRHRDDAIEERIEALEAQKEEPQKVDLVYDGCASGCLSGCLPGPMPTWLVIAFIILGIASCVLVGIIDY